MRRLALLIALVPALALGQGVSRPGSGPTTFDASAIVSGVIDPARLPSTQAPPQAAVGNSLLSGGGVAWVTGYQFAVSPATYAIQGRQYSSALTTVTLDAADATNPRIDVIAVNTSGAVVVVPGTAGETPQAPTTDPMTQLDLTFVYVPANSSQPADVSVTDIYHENVEWTATGGTGVAVNSTTTPIAGTYSVNATTATTYAQFVSGVTLDLATKNTLVFSIKSKGAWAATRSLSIYWRNGTTVRGQRVTLKDGTFGFSSSTTASVQQIVIPLSLFGINGTLVNTLRIDVAGSGTGLGFWLDDVMLQGGIPQTSNAGMVYRAAYSATTAYAVQDVVTYNGVPFVCLQAGTGQTPAVGSAYWSALVSSQPYDIAVFYPGKPGNSAIMGKVVLPRAVTIPAALSGSKCAIGTNATAQAVIAVAVSGSVSCSGTVTVATNGTCSYALATACIAAAGDVVTVTAPSSADTTMADISITVAGTR